MANLLEDIQCVGSDTQPPMLDRTDFVLWQQCIRLHCRGKKNGVNILKSIDEGPFQMGTVREPLAEGTEGSPLSKQLLFLACGQENAIDEDVDEQPIQDLALNVDKFRPSYDSNILSEVHDHDHYQDVVCAHHEEHAMHGNVQLNHVVDSHADYMSDSNMIMYDQYVEDSAVPVVHSNVSSILNDAYMMIYNDMYEPHAQSVFKTSQNIVVENSLSAKLATYKEQVELYERRARFELTEREQKINEQLRLVIFDSNFKKETLKKELHSVKLQLASTINHNKLMVEEVTSMKKPKPYHNELNKVAIGYKNPLCLTHAKQVQPALYNGYEIIKDNHVSAIVHNTYDTLEIAEITRRKMNDKIKDPKSVTHKVNIAPHYYSKENFLATFTPQKQLTPEQIFWSHDLIKMKSKALKEHTTVLGPIKALTVYPPNTPATLFLIVLPTKSQVQIHIFTLIQLFLEFDKTCKKRITPTGPTEGEMGFLTNQGMLSQGDVLEELEPEVAQNVVDRKHDEIKWKNLLIANDNLISECLSKEVFFVAMNSDLNVARFIEMHVANNIVEARCLELEAELSNLRDKSHNDNHDELVNHFSNLEITQLTAKVTALQAQKDMFRAENDKIKQHYKELYNSIKITRAKHIEQVTALTTKNVNLKAQILDTVNRVSKDHVKPKVLAPGKYAIDVEPIVPRLRNNREAHLDYLRHFKESVETIHDIVEEAKVVRPLDSSIISACRVNRCTDASGSQLKNNTKKNRISPTKGVNKMQVEEQPRRNKSHLRTTNRVDSSSRPKRSTDRPLVFRLMLLKTYNRGSLTTPEFHEKFIGTVRFENDLFGAIMGYEDYVISDSVISRVYYVEGLGHNLFSVRQFCDFDLEVAFRKHSCYVRDTNGVELIKDSRGSNLYTISVEDMMKSSPICLLSTASKQKSWLWHRRLNYLNFGTLNDLTRKDLVRGLPRLKFEKDYLCSACQLGKSKKHTYKPKTKNTNVEVLNTLHMDLYGPMRVQTINGKKYILVIVDDYSRFTWVKFLRSKDETPKAAKAVATACYTQNRSLIHTRHNKTPYELVHNKKPDLTFFKVFVVLCYPTNENKDLGKLQPTTDIGIFVGYAPSRKGPALIFLTAGQISSGLVPNPVPAAPYVPLINKDLEILFQPIFDEYLEPPRV
nr:retrovirus-related Pol polyprotein from transposon TNT 1-94 [Tanacetum cinerariifolium]